MKNLYSATTLMTFGVLMALASCSVQDEKAKPPAAPAAPVAKAEAKPPEKAKTGKANGDVGLLDTDKNYLILVTKEGKLLTLDFDQKTKVTQITPKPAKLADIGLGAAATVEYEKKGEKGVASKIDYTPAKGGD